MSLREVAALRRGFVYYARLDKLRPVAVEDGFGSAYRTFVDGLQRDMVEELLRRSGSAA